jgi:CRISPR-associated endonuclease/helicase Cas3
MFINNWLISPNNTIEIDASENLDWKSRDIYSQETILVKVPEFNFFFSYYDYNTWKIENSLELPYYIIEKLIKNNSCYIQKITVGRDTLSLWILHEGIYNYEYGIKLKKNNNPAII